MFLDILRQYNELANLVSTKMGNTYEMLRNSIESSPERRPTEESEIDYLRSCVDLARLRAMTRLMADQLDHNYEYGVKRAFIALEWDLEELEKEIQDEIVNGIEKKKFFREELKGQHGRK